MNSTAIVITVAFQTLGCAMVSMIVCITKTKITARKYSLVMSPLVSDMFFLLSLLPCFKVHSLPKVFGGPV